MDKLDIYKEKMLRKKYIIAYYITILCIVAFLIANI